MLKLITLLLVLFISCCLSQDIIEKTINHINETDFDDFNIPPNVDWQGGSADDTTVKTEIFEDCPSIHAFIQGPPGRDGLPGVPGERGAPGAPGRSFDKNSGGSPKASRVKQCAWDSYNYAPNFGRVQHCSIIKMYSSSMLRVEWHGSTRVKCKNNTECCNRWYFTFDGAECRNPQTIDGLVYLNSGSQEINIHRTMSVVGICDHLSAGFHEIEFWVGHCHGNYVRGQTRTGWNSSSRIILTEL